MDVIVHIGAHRTGSTKFKTHLNHNTGYIKSQGWAHWPFPYIRKDLVQGLFYQNTAEDLTNRLHAIKKISRNLNRLLAYGRAGLVTSEENLSGYMLLMLQKKTLYPNVTHRVSGFLEAAKGHNVTIGFGIRSYDTWWASVIAFQLAEGKPKYWTPRSCRHLVQQPRRWRHVVAEMAAANPNTRIVVWPYEDYAASPGNILGHLSNGRLQTQDTPDRKNQRPDMARIKHRLRYFWLRSKKLVDEQGRFQPFTQGQQSILRDHYAKDIEWFCTQTDYNNIEFLQRSE